MWDTVGRRSRSRTRRRRVLLGGGLALVAAAAVASAVIGSDSGLQADAPHASDLPAALVPEVGWDPIAALGSLTVIDDGTSLARTAYDRDFFGQRWLDVDRNGCDTRNDTLRRDLDDLAVREGTQGCVAQSGVLVDAYTGEEFVFERGTAHAGELHVDHIVALSDAWHKGAEGWSEDRRAEFANDPTNLVVTFGPVNLSKGANDAASWVPPDEDAWCGFAVHVVWVKEEYDLAVTEDEVDSLGQLLSTCHPSSPALVGVGSAGP
ncbi:HNH endonuclease family protein [Ornithinimicrobium sufpigmenti]|uniref:HNH endonuclease family protein n=1 Tax=Ornithinimicrobium sufpigmenti TaxID=2508882 RepID=UPI0015E15C7F|nr:MULTISPECIES: HNH endonuclease family protein [unclassified Ornithinimicrobium]